LLIAERLHLIKGWQQGMIMIYQRLSVVLGLLVVMVFGFGQIQVHAGKVETQVDPRSKISFNLGQLNDLGLYGPPNGLLALDYEFCIPADPAFEVQVKAIDPTIVIFTGSKGRVGCVPGEKLCIGNTHQPEFKTVLFKLAGLPYVKKINQCFYE
jgi:hypothetical protein